MITHQTAAMIVESVVTSPKTRDLLENTLPDFVQNLGWAGDIRNIGLEFVGFLGGLVLPDSTSNRVDGEIAKRVCIGIADATTDDIRRYMAAGKLPDVESVGFIDRGQGTGASSEHTATLVKMRDGTAYVFDWHSTLNAKDPLVTDWWEWRQGQNGPRYMNMPWNGLQNGTPYFLMPTACDPRNCRIAPR